MRRDRHRRFAWLLAVATGLASSGTAATSGDLVIHPSSWRVIDSESGPVNYYTVVRDDRTSFVRARYRPALETVVLGWQTPDSAKKTAHRLRWEWRALKLPPGGNDCVKGKGDSAASVYVTWKRGLKYYTLKYVWSGGGQKGGCKRKRNPFVSEDAVVLQAGPPLDTWRTVDLDLRKEFQRHFEGGDPKASVPDFVGLGILTDGDQTRSESAADYGSFTLSR